MLQFHPFGKPKLTSKLDGRPLSLTTPALVLIAVLAYEPGPHPRRQLARIIWPDTDDRSARNSLKTALCALRKHLAPEAICETADGLALQPGHVNIYDLKCVTHEGYAEFMDGIEIEWAIDIRLRLRRAASNSAVSAAEKAATSQDVHLAIALAELAVTIDPYSEEAAKLRANLLRKTNRHLEAASTEQRYRHRMFRDLGSLPRPEGNPLPSSHPLVAACEWLLDRSPVEAADFLLAARDQWPTMNASVAVKLHDRIQFRPRLSDSVKLKLAAQRMLIRWGLDGLSGDLAEAETLMEVAAQSGEPEAAVTLGVAIAYAYLSRGDTANALAYVSAADRLAHEKIADRNSRHRIRLVYNIVNLQGRKRPYDPRFVRSFIDDFSEASPLERADADQTQGALHLAAGNLALADEHLRAARSYHEASGAIRTLAWIGAEEAELYCRAGDPAVAYSILKRLLDNPPESIGQSAYCMLLDRAAVMACHLGQYRDAAEKFALAAYFRRGLGTRRSAFERERLSPFKQAVSNRLGPELHTIAHKVAATAGDPAGIFA
jgi:tetratricopeptide (TPR) repeat protein